MDKVSKTPGNSLFNRDNIFKYAKNVGIVCYSGLGICVSQPGILRSRQFDLTNSLLVGSLVGVTVYLYERQHLRDVKVKSRLWLSVYGSSLFNCGSLLIWAIVRSATQDYNLHPIFRSFLSLVASHYMIQSGINWIEIIDSKTN